MCRRNYDIFGDSYFGSGKWLKRALEKDGLENFQKEIIYVFNNKIDAYSWEKAVVTQELVDDPMCYNIKLGGFGGDTFTDNPNKEMIRQKLRITTAGKRNPMYGRTGEKSPHYGKKQSAEHIAKRCGSGPKNGMYGKHLSDEHKQVLRDAFSGQNNPMSKTNRDLRATKGAETLNKSVSAHLRYQEKC